MSATENDTIHLFADNGSFITLCCRTYVLDKRLHLGTFNPEAATCTGTLPVSQSEGGTA